MLRLVRRPFGVVVVAAAVFAFSPASAAFSFAAFAFTAFFIFFGLKCVSATSGGFLGHVGVVFDQERG